MLVLSRKERERIKIGDNVVITVRRINGNRVRLGVEAPPDTVIRRGELPEETMTESAGEPGEANGGRPEAVGG